MDDRRSFTFFRSFYEAIRELDRPEDRDAVCMAVCAYALDGTEPDLCGVPAALFTLMRPNLDASRRKAESGHAGGAAQADPKQTTSRTKASSKQTQSRPRAKQKQTAREGEREGEIEIENDISPPLPPSKKPKVQWADNVTMTNDEHDKLLATYGPADTVRLIEILDNYKGSTGKAYQDDYRAILSWCVERLQEERAKPRRGGRAPTDRQAADQRAMEEMDQTRRLMERMRQEEGG